MAFQRQNGIYYTRGNPFNNQAFRLWAEASHLSENEILEPFAGRNSLINTLTHMGLCRYAKSYDIIPASSEVLQRDTLADFPKGFSVCVTNPPWLAKNSATARGIEYPQSIYDNLYKIALDKSLANCDWVAALVPESFVRANLFQKRLAHFVSLTGKMFHDTDHPVGLALFEKAETEDVKVWKDNEFIGCLSDLEKVRPAPSSSGVSVKFNAIDGNVGLIALDNTLEASIRFCDVKELQHYHVKHSSRHITKIAVSSEVKIDAWNKCLTVFREKTKDVLLTCYKGLRKDGCYRRRCDWNLARGIIHYVQ